MTEQALSTDTATTAPEDTATTDTTQTTEVTTETPEQTAEQTALQTATADEWTPAKVPEKYHVKNDKGELDEKATFAKVEAARAAAEKRLGTGDLPPKTAAEYKLPEGFDLPIDEGKQKEFFEAAHKLGVTQPALDFMLNQFKNEIGELSGLAPNPDAVVTEMKELWGGDWTAEAKTAGLAVDKLSAATGIPTEEIYKAVGNNMTAIKLLNYLGKEMGEDTPESNTPSTVSDIDALMKNPAYLDAKHPDHAKVSAQVKDYFDKGGK